MIIVRGFSKKSLIMQSFMKPDVLWVFPCISGFVITIQIIVPTEYFAYNILMSSTQNLYSYTTHECESKLLTYFLLVPVPMKNFSPKVIVFISATWRTWLILDLGVLAAPWSVWIFVSSNIYFSYQQETVQTASENLKYHTPALCDVVIRDGVVNWCPIEQLLLWLSPWSGWGFGQNNCQQ